MIGYGQDTWCTNSLKPGRLVRGALLVGQAAYRRLITPRGRLRGGEAESNYGLGLSEMIGHVGGPRLAASLPAIVRAELLKDDRIADVTTQAVWDASTSTLNVVIVGMLHDSADNFELTLSVSEVTTTLLGLKAA